MQLCAGADVIIDPVGAAYWQKHSKCVAMDGRVLHIGFVSPHLICAPMLLLFLTHIAVDSCSLSVLMSDIGE